MGETRLLSERAFFTHTNDLYEKISDTEEEPHLTYFTVLVVDVAGVTGGVEVVRSSVAGVELVMTVPVVEEGV